MLELICDRATGIAVESLFSDQPKRLGGQMHGTEVPIRCVVVDRLPNPTADNRIWEPVDLSAWTSVYACIGQGFKIAVAGYQRILSGIDKTAGPLVVGKTYKIVNFNAGDNFLNVGAASNASGVYFVASGTTPTTWTNASVLHEATTPFAFDADETVIQARLTATQWISDAGGVVVSVLGSRYFAYTYNTNGARVEMYADASGLAPLSVVDFGTLVDGDAETREVQSSRQVQVAAAKNELTEDTAPALADVTVVQVGGVGNNHQVRVTLTPPAYGGSWTLTVGGNQTGFIPYNSDEATLIAALVALASVGANNATATKEDERTWLIMFIGGKANTDMGAITSGSAALKSVKGKEGILYLNNASMELMLAGQNQVSASMQIEGYPAGATAPEYVLRLSDVVCIDSINDPSSETPSPRASFYNKTESDARYAFKSVAGFYRFKTGGEFQIYDTVGYRTLSSDADGNIILGAREA